MYLSVCPDSLDALASDLANLTPRIPTAAAVVADLEALGVCLPGFAAGPGAGRLSGADGRSVGDPWARSLGDLAAAWVGHGADLRRSAHSYREVDERRGR